MEREGLTMVYLFPMFRHYLLGNRLNHYALKYLINKLTLGEGGGFIDGYYIFKNMIFKWW